MTLHPILRWLLWPLSLLYGGAVVLRARLYRSGIFQANRLSGVVISVGNLTTGGTGKTPMVLLLAQHLIERGESLGILSRGYRGAQATLGSPGTDGVATRRICSDEVQLLSHRLRGKTRFGVGADRYFHGLALEREGIQWFILDDGFQHLQLARDADILLLDAHDPFGSGHLLPAGRLREPKPAMARADIIVITRSEHAPALESVVRRYSRAPIFYAATELKEIYREGDGSGDTATADWLGKRMFVFCGIGNPGAFVENVGHWGMEVAGHMAFRDHHRYTPADASEIERRAAACGAQAMICTEKDSYNLRAADFRALPLYVCRIATRLTDPAGFWQALNQVIARRRGG